MDYLIHVYLRLLLHITMTEFLRKNTEPIYTLGVASKLSSTPQHSIRQYIDRGLIIPHKTATNRHLFSDTDLNRLLWIKKQLSENGLNFAGIKSLYSLIPCWKIKPCSVETRASCEAYTSSNTPCWEASNKGPKCKNEDCRYCKVYQISGQELNIKTILKDLLP